MVMKNQVMKARARATTWILSSRMKPSSTIIDPDMQNTFSRLSTILNSRRISMNIISWATEHVTYISVDLDSFYRTEKKWR
jgi:hypothetical protein